MSKEQKQQDGTLFITSFSQPQRKQTIKKPFQVEQLPDDLLLNDLIKKCDELMSECRDINVNECLSEYRTISSKYRRMKIGIESEIKKIQTCAVIDIQYLKKLFNNEPKMSYDFINTKIDQEQQQLDNIMGRVQKMREKVQFIEEEVG